MKPPPYAPAVSRAVTARERMCHNKRVYLDKGTAQVQAGQAARKAGMSLRAYHCPNCLFWHLTAAPLR